MGKQKTRSPLKDNPLRNPGQSLDEQINKLLDDKLLNYILFSVMLTALALTEWYRWYVNASFSPKLFSAVAIVAVLYSVVKVRPLLRQVKHLRQGRDGERAVGQYLEELRESGCKVLHDIVADNFNIDHLVLSEKGIFLIETKTFSKPLKGEPIIKYDGEKLLINGHEPDRNPVVQAKASARWLHDFLQETTGKSFPIKPVVLFPGWFIQTTVRLKPSDAWVLEPKAFAKFLANEREIIPATDMHLIKSRIAQHVRASNSAA